MVSFCNGNLQHSHGVYLLSAGKAMQEILVGTFPRDWSGSAAATLEEAMALRRKETTRRAVVPPVHEILS
jgi:hypothetical protein